MEGYIGEIRMFAGNFSPRSWALCNGQLLSIAQNTALFSILGTTYGGNGQTTFGLPDFRGRVPVGTGSAVTLGEIAGAETVTLTTVNLPQHTHTVNGTIALLSNPSANAQTPANNYFANDGSKKYDGQQDGVNMMPLNNTLSVGLSGSGQPYDNLMPYMSINYIVCLYGIFPSRN